MKYPNKVVDIMGQYIIIIRGKIQKNYKGSLQRMNINEIMIFLCEVSDNRLVPNQDAHFSMRDLILVHSNFKVNLSIIYL